MDDNENDKIEKPDSKKSVKQLENSSLENERKNSGFYQDSSIIKKLDEQAKDEGLSQLRIENELKDEMGKN